MKILDWAKGKKPYHIIPDLSQVTKEQSKYLKSLKIMICSPSRESIVCGNYHLTTLAIAKWAALLGVQVDTQLLFGCSYIEQGRNTLANTFWNSDCTHLFFIDTDNGTMANHFFELLLCQKDIIGATYPKRNFNWEAVRQAALDGVPAELLAHSSGFFTHHMRENCPITVGHEPQRVLTLPAGFLCISRNALKKYTQKYLERKTTLSNPQHQGMQFFRAGTFEQLNEKGEKYVSFDSEDNHFCKDMLRLGIDTYLAPWVPVSHQGEYLYESCLPCSHGAYVHTPGWVEAKNQEKAVNGRA